MNYVLFFLTLLGPLFLFIGFSTVTLFIEANIKNITAKINTIYTKTFESIELPIVADIVLNATSPIVIVPNKCNGRDDRLSLLNEQKKTIISTKKINVKTALTITPTTDTFSKFNSLPNIQIITI